MDGWSYTTVDGSEIRQSPVGIRVSAINSSYSYTSFLFVGKLWPIVGCDVAVSFQKVYPHYTQLEINMDTENIQKTAGFSY